MCLTRVNVRIENPTQEVTKAFKVFIPRKEVEKWEIYREYRDSDNPIKTNVWERALEKSIFTDSFKVEGYVSGFHCYLIREDAEKHYCKEYQIIVEVEVKEITCYGDQWSTDTVPCLVARRMFIPKKNIEKALKEFVTRCS